VWSRHLIVQLSTATTYQLVYRTNLTQPTARPRTHTIVEAVNDRDSCQIKQGHCIIGRERVTRKNISPRFVLRVERYDIFVRRVSASRLRRWAGRAVLRNCLLVRISCRRLCNVFLIIVSIFATAVAHVISLQASVKKSSPSTVVTRRCNGAVLFVRKRKKNMHRAMGYQVYMKLKGSGL
jgi:hypothetical protein